MTPVRALGFALLFSTLVLLAGCSASFSPANQPSAYSIPAIKGSVFGGQQPVTGSHVYLYATGTASLNSASRSVLTAAVQTNSPSNYGEDASNNYYVTTDAYGDFSISGDYTCTTGESLYLYAIGGNSGAGTGSNPHIGMLSALGTCTANTGDLSGTVSYIQINEISTIATAYALAGFGQTATAIGSGSTTLATTGMANAIANVANIYNPATGMPRATTLGSTASYIGTPPANKMLWLADVLASCVNTDPTDSNGNCASLFAAMPSPYSGITTADTAQVAFNLAHTQAASSTTINALTGLIPGQKAYNYTATTYTDLALPVVYAIPAMQQPAGIAIDASGNLWIPDDGETDLPVYELSPQGVGSSFTPTGAGTTYLSNLAISPYDNSLWLYNIEGEAVDVFSNTGTYKFAARVPTGRIPDAGPVVFDGSGNAYYPSGSSKFDLIEDSPTNTTVNSGYASTSTSTGSTPFIALDSNLNAWVSGSSKFYVFTSTAAAPTATVSNNYDAAITAGPHGLIWYYNPSTTLELESYSYNSSTSAVVAGPTCTGSDLTYTYGGGTVMPSIAVDGGGNLWVGVNYSNNSSTVEAISGFSTTATTCTAITTTSGINTGTVPSYDSYSIYLAADASGNLWSANIGVDVPDQLYENTVTQFLGLSVPAVTPINPALAGTAPQ